jgi:hypothetical protein
VLTAPDVVHQDVEASGLDVDPFDAGLDLRQVEMVGGNGDALPARLGDELGGLLDRLRAPVLGLTLPRGSPRAVDGCAGRAQFDGDPTAGAASGAGDQGNLAIERSGHRAGP